MKTKLISLALTVALLCSMSATVFAATPTNASTAAGYLLDYSVDTVVVPTVLKMTLNPNQYPVTTKYEEAAADYDSNTTYYTESGGVYTKATGLTAFAANTTYYTAVQSKAQVVSFNYGIVSKATTEKKVTISLAANYTASTTSGDGAITFVDSIEKARAYDETDNPDGAKRGELKIYLAAVASDAKPTAETYKKTTHKTINAATKYYAKNASGYVSITSGDISTTSGGVITTSTTSGGVVYESTTEIGPEISADELADVTMSVASGADVAFAAGTTHKADAKFAFKLSPAGYTVKEGQIIDFTTQMGDLDDKLELSTIGGIAAFTLTGAINASADWTKSEASAIVITPTYTIEDADGTETDSGGYHQISVTPAATAPSIATTTYQVNLANPANVDISVSLGSGNLAAQAVVGAYCFVNGAKFDVFDPSMVSWNASTNQVTVVGGSAKWFVDNNQPLTIVFDDDATSPTEVQITFTAA